MLGLKRGEVALCAHEEQWREVAERTISRLRAVLEGVAIDIQHVGSTAISGICAKPIIDIAVGLLSLQDVKPLTNALEQSGFIFRGQDIEGQLLFVMGDFEADTRTHHIHMVQWDSDAWRNYINFRDYLNAVPDQAMRYDALKRELAQKYSQERALYTQGKQRLIHQLLANARIWRSCLIRAEYPSDPCRICSIPYWKTRVFPPPPASTILHDALFTPALLRNYEDVPYFRLKHDLTLLREVSLPQGFSLRAASFAEFAAHISLCYPGLTLSEETLADYAGRPVYSSDLWLAVQEDKSGVIAASGIAELDAQMSEGALEWIQVSPEYRRRGLGRYVVCELLNRMKGRAAFATVSGKANHPDRPEALYRACGFAGSGVWHLLTRKTSC